jgi:AcrR family transcriptional regulator
MSGSRRSYHHGDLRSAVLHRAAEIIRDQGIEALSLRAIARDLGVSHGAPNRHFKSKADLLTALAVDSWRKITDATLAAGAAMADGSAHQTLNAMGRGYLGWALRHRAEFIALTHPDVNRYAFEELDVAMTRFRQAITSAVAATQAEGRHPGVPLTLLTLYTNSVPFGLASLLSNRFDEDLSDDQLDEMIVDLIELVVPTRT